MTFFSNIYPEFAYKNMDITQNPIYKIIEKRQVVIFHRKRGKRVREQQQQHLPPHDQSEKILHLPVMAIEWNEHQTELCQYPQEQPRIHSEQPK